MAKGKVTINIKKKNFQYIDGQTGKRMTKEEVDRKYGKGVKVSK